MYSQKLLVGNILHGFLYFVELKAQLGTHYSLDPPRFVGREIRWTHFPNFYQNSQQLYKEYSPSPLLADSAIVIEKAAQK